MVPAPPEVSRQGRPANCRCEKLGERSVLLGLLVGNARSPRGQMQ